MEKGWKFLAILWISLILCGCEEERISPPAVVTLVQIRCTHAGAEIERSYTQPEQMEAVLDCLRLQRSRGTAQVDPERLKGAAYEIRVWMSDGSAHIYRHRGGQYLSRDSRPWQRVDPEQAQTLHALLEEYL